MVMALPNWTMALANLARSDGLAAQRPVGAVEAEGDDSDWNVEGMDPASLQAIIIGGGLNLGAGCERGRTSRRL